MKILLSAYACEPDRGSEPEVGFQAMLAAAEGHDVWVLTRANNLNALEAALRRNPVRGRIRLVGLDLGRTALWVKRRGLLGLHWYYDRWQAAAAEHGRRLDRDVGFDLVHHVTFASHWTRAGVAEVGKPFLWGPVGGGVEPLLGLFPVLGTRGIIEDLGRLTLRRFNECRPCVRALRVRAALTLVQNEETRRRLPGAGHTEMLPNAVAATVDGVHPSSTRDASIAFVGRLTPWKGAVLAVRSLQHVRHPDAVLKLYGDGPDRARIERVARARGLESRVLFMGRVRREVLLAELARAGTLLHPAMHDECPLSVAEALSLRTPVVALAHGGPRELVRWWPESPSALVAPGTPDRTARRLAVAVDRFLEERGPATPSSFRVVHIDREHPQSASAPRRTFRELLLAAYERVGSAP